MFCWFELTVGCCKRGGESEFATRVGVMTPEYVASEAMKLVEDDSLVGECLLVAAYHTGIHKFSDVVYFGKSKL